MINYRNSRAQHSTIFDRYKIMRTSFREDANGTIFDRSHKEKFVEFGYWLEYSRYSKFFPILTTITARAAAQRKMSSADFRSVLKSSAWFLSPRCFLRETNDLPTSNIGINFYTKWTHKCDISCCKLRNIRDAGMTKEKGEKKPS